MERTFRFKNSIGLARITLAPGGNVEVVYSPFDDRLPSRRVPCPDLLAGLQEIFVTHQEADPFTIDFHYYNDDDEELSTMPESLPPFICEKPCPRCRELLRWSEHENPPSVAFDTRTGKVWHVMLMRFCIACRYKEKGLVNVNKEPSWVELKES
jgi:hypothetical protein